MSFKAGDRVVKNPAKWMANDFDGWGRGEGVGEVVEATLYPDGWQIDVRWPYGRCYETVDQLLPAPPGGGEKNFGRDRPGLD